MKKSILIIFSTLIMLRTDAQDKRIPFAVAGDPTVVPCKDKDGNSYTTVKIGTQIWMAENLKTTRYNDGSPIPLVTDNKAWKNSESPGYCWYKNDDQYKGTYGALYNWFTVNTGKLAPAGWHVPSDSEWTVLAAFLGDKDIVGGKMKEAGTAHWKAASRGATNTSGFTGLPGGYRDYNGLFQDLASKALFWTTSAVNRGDAWLRELHYSYDYVNRFGWYQVHGYSIRCIKDDISTIQPSATGKIFTDTTTMRSVPDFYRPENPSGFTATRNFNGDIILTWNAVPNAVNYNLQGPGVKPGLTRPGAAGQVVYVNGTTYTVKGLQAGIHTWGLFTMYNGSNGPYFGDELNPSITSLTIMANPTGFKAVQQANGDVILTWNAVLNAMNYNLQGPGVKPGLTRPGSGGQIVYVNGTNYTIKGLQAGTHTWGLFAMFTGPNGPYFGDELNPAKTSLTIIVKTQPVSTVRWTTFDPKKHGFRFVNSFNNTIIPPSWVSRGLCGGMSYTVLDYYNASRPIPNQLYRPADKTTLQQYLYNRQATSLAPLNMAKWVALSVNPGGIRTTEFFNWGINEELRALRLKIDQGLPVVLGLKAKEGILINDHQVLAIGYDAGRYQGDLGNYIEDIRIYIFDPNHPNETQTLVPNPVMKEYYYLGYTDEKWRTYFVDNTYAFVNPPIILNPVYPADGLIHELLFEFNTGADDMRGGADHVDIRIIMKDNTITYYPNISQDGRWLPGYTETAQVILRQPVATRAISSFAVLTNASGGLVGDKWDLDSVIVKAVIGGDNPDGVFMSKAGPYQFSGTRVPLVIYVR